MHAGIPLAKTDLNSFEQRTSVNRREIKMAIVSCVRSDQKITDKPPSYLKHGKDKMFDYIRDLLFGCEDTNNSPQNLAADTIYSCPVCGEKRAFRNVIHINWTCPSCWGPMRRIHKSHLTLKAWHDVLINVRGSHHTISVDGQGQAEFDDETYTSSNIIVGGENSSFKNPVVKEMN
jgi:hypothetical protein